MDEEVENMDEIYNHQVEKPFLLSFCPKKATGRKMKAIISLYSLLITQCINQYKENIQKQWS